MSHHLPPVVLWLDRRTVLPDWAVSGRRTAQSGNTVLWSSNCKYLRRKYPKYLNNYQVKTFSQVFLIFFIFFPSLLSFSIYSFIHVGAGLWTHWLQAWLTSKVVMTSSKETLKNLHRFWFWLFMFWLLHFTVTLRHQLVVGVASRPVFFTISTEAGSV